VVAGSGIEPLTSGL